MATLGDVFMLTTSARYYMQLIQNVFFYRITDTPSTGAPEGLVTDFISDVLPAIAAVQSSDLNYFSVKVVNIFDAAELYEEGIDVDGSRGTGTDTDDGATFLALGVLLRRSNARVRNGYKYFAGLVEGDISNNVWILGGAAQANLEAALAADLNPGSVDNFEPVIVKRVRTTVNTVNGFGQTVSHYQYSLPVSQVEMDDNWATVAQASVNLQLTTMRSRKAGHGV